MPSGLLRRDGWRSCAAAKAGRRTAAAVARTSRLRDVLFIGSLLRSRVWTAAAVLPPSRDYLSKGALAWQTCSFSRGCTDEGLPGAPATHTSDADPRFQTRRSAALHC